MTTHPTPEALAEALERDHAADRTNFDHMIQAADLIRTLSAELAAAKQAHAIAVEIAAHYAAERDSLRAEVERLKPKWEPIEAAPDDMAECVAVRWVNSEGEECHDLDYKEEGTWRHWNDRAEHTEMIGGHGVSYTPPYAGWLPLPPPPVAEGV